MSNFVDSASDQCTVNNVMRHEYRVLSDSEKQTMQAIKDKGLELYDLIESIGQSRELSIAKTKTEEAVMWAVKALLSVAPGKGGLEGLQKAAHYLEYLISLESQE